MSGQYDVRIVRDGMINPVYVEYLKLKTENEQLKKENEELKHKNERSISEYIRKEKEWEEEVEDNKKLNYDINELINHIKYQGIEIEIRQYGKKTPKAINAELLLKRLGYK